MAIGPTTFTATDVESVIKLLEARIDGWLLLQNGNASQGGYVLPFWVFRKPDQDAFLPMLERYRAAGWTSVVVESHDGIFTLVFKS